MTGPWMIAAMLLAAPAQSQAELEAAMPGWMAGAWCTEGPKTDRTCEYWTPESGGLMIGASITTKAGKAVSFEQARIVGGFNPHGPTIIYIASPEGAPAVSFLDVPVREGKRISFENKEHDYPQRIRYWMEDDAMIAEVALADGSKPMRWRFKRVG
jgi:hypothetical protein